MKPGNEKFLFTTPPELPDDEIKATGKLDFLKDDDRYINHGLFDQGGMKCLYKIEDTFTGKQFIRASLNNDKKSADDIKDFLNEAKITSLLDHPNIPPVHEISAEDDLPYFLMKLIKGKNLSEITVSEGSVMESAKINSGKLNRRLEIFLKICDAISYAHSKNIVHLDLKPANIVVGEFGEVYVCDWGLAVNLKEPQEEFDIRGTPGFMAPEQYLGEFEKIKPGTDIFSLGVLLYTVLYNDNPFRDAKTMEMIKKNITVNFESLIDMKGIPGINKIILKAVELDTEDRYSSVKEMAEDVRNFLNKKMLSVESGFTVWLVKLIKRNPRVSAISLIGLVLVMLIFFSARSIIKDVTYSKKLAELESQRLKGVNDDLIHNASLEFFEKAAHLDNLYKFEECQHYISMAINFKCTLPEAYLIQARMLLGSLKFSEAIEYFNKEGSPVSEKYTEIINYCRKEKDIKKSLTYLIQNIEPLKGGKRTVDHIFRNNAQLFSENFTPFELFKLLNPKLKENEFIYSQADKSLKVTAESLSNISPLHILNLNSLDLSKCTFGNLLPLRKSNISKLILAHSIGGNLWALAENKQLKELDVSYCEIDSLNALRDLSLSKLNIAGAQISEIQSILSIDKINELICHEKQLKKSIVKKLESKGTSVKTVTLE